MKPHNQPTGTIRALKRRRLRYEQEDQDSTSAVTPSLLTDHSRAAACARDPAHSGQAARAVRGAQPFAPRWLAGRPRVTGAALTAAGWAATFAAVIAGSPLGRGAAAQIIFAATMITCAAGETLLSPALPVIIEDRAPSGAEGRYKRLGTLALVTICLLGPLAGGTALGADWGTSLFTTLAVACAVAGIAAHRLGRQLAPGANRIPVVGAHPAADGATSPLGESETPILATTGETSSGRAAAVPPRPPTASVIRG